ncbi:MAG TPA: DoxX family protein [Ktedonobacteraceae bacterium]
MSQLVSVSRTSSTSRKLTTVTLWTVQILLALIFLFAGGMKLIVPTEVMVAQMPLKVSGLFIHFVGVCEVAGALGLVLPGLTRIWRVLTPLAAAALVVEMVGATIYTLLGGGGVSAVFPLVVGLLCAVVVYNRRSYLSRD